MKKKFFDFNFIFSFISKLIKPPCFQHFNIEKVENFNDSKNSNIITHKSNIYNNLYINNKSNKT